MTEVLKKEEVVKPSVPMVNLTVDGQAVSVPKGTTVLEAAKLLNIHIPTFCWHPKLKSVGACRMCYVEVEKMPKLQVSCSLEAIEGMVVHTDSDQVKRGRKAVIEFILLNHPLDCPTCDKGGECDLQNLTFAHGYDDSRFEFQKYRFVEEETRTTFDDLRIGPEIILNRNRCILCYKCVRANKEAFGEYDLGAYERGNITEINAAPGEQVDNPFSGNLVEICPVGALTNTDWRYQIRVWLTKTTPSICNFTSSGTNITFYKEDHQNKIFRVTSRRNDEIDDGWLADVTRYGYQIVNSQDRLKTPLIKKNGKQVPASWEEALKVIQNRMGEISEKLGGVCLGALASPNLDNATLYSLSKFMRTVFDSNNIDFRSDYRMLPKKAESSFEILRSRPFRIADIDTSDVILTFGSDLVREHPNEYLRIRKARNFGSPRILAFNPYEVKSSDVADIEAVYAAGTEEQVLNGICLAAIEGNLVDAQKAEEYRRQVHPNRMNEAAKMCGVPEESLKLAARFLSEGRKLTVFAGEMVTSSRERELISTAMINLDLLFGISKKGQLVILPRYANSRGAEQLGLLPEPHQKTREALKNIWGKYPESAANSTDAMMALIKKEEIKGLLVIGANPVMLYPDRAFVKEALEKLDFLVVCDLFETATTELADVVLPLTSWAEYEGDYINLEGRLQTAHRAVKPKFEAKPGFEIVRAISKEFGASLFENERQMKEEIDQLLKTEMALPLPDSFLECKPEPNAAIATDKDYPLPLFIVDDPHHCGYLTERAPSLISFASEPYVEMSHELAAKYHLEPNQPVRLVSESAKLVLPVKISDYLEAEVLLVPRNFSSSPVNSLVSRKKRVDYVRITQVDE